MYTPPENFENGTSYLDWLKMHLLLIVKVTLPVLVCTDVLMSDISTFNAIGIKNNSF